MKNYKLTIIITFCLMLKKLAFCLLIDGFSDKRWSKHALTSGTEVSTGLIRQLEGSWRFLKDTNRLLCKNKTGFGTLTYGLNGADVTSDSISSIILNTYLHPSVSSSINISLFDKNNSKRMVNISFKGMSAGTPFILDLADKNEHVDDPGFDEMHINKIELAFNPYAVKGFEIGLESIEAVPEPFSIITLAGGTLSFIRKKRQKNN